MRNAKRLSDSDMTSTVDRGINPPVSVALLSNKSCNEFVSICTHKFVSNSDMLSVPRYLVKGLYCPLIHRRKRSSISMTQGQSIGYKTLVTIHYWISLRKGLVGSDGT